MIIKNVGMKAVDSGVYKAMRNRAIFSKFLMERTKIIGNLGMGSSLSERSNRFFSSNINEKKKGIAFSSLLQLSQISYHRDLEYCYKVDPNNFELLLNYLKSLNQKGDYKSVINEFKMVRKSKKDILSEDESYLIQKQYYHALERLKETENKGDKYENYAVLAVILYLLYVYSSDFQNLFSRGVGGSGIDNNLESKMGIGAFDITPEKDIKTSFSDVLGIDEFKEEFLEIVDYLKNPKKYEEVGAKIPKGFLLSGQPGTGKTLIAKALAGDSGCAFFFKSGSEFDELYVGVAAKRIKQQFEEARKCSPSIIFIDEIDSIAGRRNNNEIQSYNEAINQILTEMDGFKENEQVIVIGATNLEESLDPAIKRPGRFDKIINVPLPDVKGRKDILQFYLNKIQHNKDTIDVDVLSKRTTGFSGAELKNLVNLAILNTVKLNKEFAETDNFDYAYDRILMGTRRPGLLVDYEDKRATAFHEVGHALIAFLTLGTKSLYKLTIQPKGSSLGHTALVPEDELSTNKKKLVGLIDVALGGRASEEVFLGYDQVSTGCSSDLDKATNVAYQYVRSLAMNDDVSLISSDKKNLSDQFNFKIDMEVQNILKKSMEKVKQELLKHKGLVNIIVDELIEKETLSNEEFDLIYKKYQESNPRKPNN